MKLDYIIKNARVCTGKLEQSVVRNVGILNGKIVDTPQLSDSDAICIIDGTGMILAPGFIDPHASTGFGYFFPKAADHKLYQGITTEIFGNCGTSPAPIGSHLKSTMNELSDSIGFPFDWETMAEYFDRIKGNLQFNIATLVGHSTLRAGSMDDWHILKPEQMEEMKRNLAQSMDEGSLGLSTGLIYAPGCFAEIEEIIDLAKVVAEKGGVYASHIRDERNNVEEAVEEALTISKKANIRTLISHLKAAEKQNWGKVPKILKQIELFNKENPELQAAIDVYPYTAISTKLRAFIPKNILQDGIDKIAGKLQSKEVLNEIADWIVEREYDLDLMMIISDESETYFGKTVAQISHEQKLSEAETIAQILTLSTETWIVYHCIGQEDIDAAVLWGKSMICTDSWSYPINAPKSIGQPHPRSYAAFTAYLERYVMDMDKLTWEEAIHKITYLPAEFFNLNKRGEIANGYHADLVLLDPNTLKANATYIAPRELSSGVNFLWVNGKLVIEKGVVIDECPGEILTFGATAN